MSKIRVTKTKSLIGQSKKIKKIVDSMGLRKIGHTKEFPDNNCIRGQVNKVQHLVRYELVK